MISPPEFVTASAAPKERQFSDCEQLTLTLESFPVVDTKVRLAEACAVVVKASAIAAVASTLILSRGIRIFLRYPCCFSGIKPGPVFPFPGIAEI